MVWKNNGKDNTFAEPLLGTLKQLFFMNHFETWCRDEIGDGACNNDNTIKVKQASKSLCQFYKIKREVVEYNWKGP